MPKQVQMRRGTTAQHALFAGAVGEATVDTTRSALVVHDGATLGGFPALREADAYKKADSDVRYSRKTFSGLFNILDYGADPTGATSSRNALQAACNAARAVGGTVTSQPGYYRLDIGMPIYVGGCHFELLGKFFASLPSDYTNPNVYDANDSYTAHNQLDSSGNLVDWVSSSVTDNPYFKTAYYGLTPWNGKAPMFEGFGGSTGLWRVRGLIYDGGWGTTGAPITIRAITGVRLDMHEEYTLGVTCPNCRNVVFEKCEFANTIGHIWNGLGPVTLRDVTCKNWMDHCVYFGNATDIHCDNVRMLADRETVSTSGNASYVFGTFREPMKFTKTKRWAVTHCTCLDTKASPSVIFLSLNAPGWATGTDCENGLVTGCQVSAKGFLDTYNSRGTGDGAGARIKNVRFIGNDIEITGSGQFIQAYGLAADDWKFQHNTIRLGSGSWLGEIDGARNYAAGVRRMIFDRNDIIFTSLGQAALWLSGKVEGVHFKDNDISNLDTGFTSAAKFVYPYGASYDQENDLKMIRFNGNTFRNVYAPWYDIGRENWVSGQAYPREALTTDEGTYYTPRVVHYSGKNYRNKAAVTGTTNPAADTANWEEQTIPACRFEFRRNTLIFDSTTIPTALLSPGRTDRPLSHVYRLKDGDNELVCTTAEVAGTFEFAEGNFGTLKLDRNQENIILVSGTYNIKPTDRLVGIAVSGANALANLPPVAMCVGKEISICRWNYDATYTVNVTPAAGEYIWDSGADYVISTTRTFSTFRAVRTGTTTAQWARIS